MDRKKLSLILTMLLVLLVACVCFCACSTKTTTEDVTVAMSDSGVTFSYGDHTAFVFSTDEAPFFSVDANGSVSFSSDVGEHTLVINAVDPDNQEKVLATVTVKYTTVAISLSSLTTNDRTVSWTAVAKETLLKEETEEDEGEFEPYASSSYTAHETVKITVRAVGGFDAEHMIFYAGKTVNRTATVTIDTDILETPALEVKDGYIVWEPVEDAAYYEVSVNDGDYSAAEKVRLRDEAGKYTVKVRAVAGDADHSDSDPASLSYETVITSLSAQKIAADTASFTYVGKALARKMKSLESPVSAAEGSADELPSVIYKGGYAYEIFTGDFTATTSGEYSFVSMGGFAVVKQSGTNVTKNVYYPEDVEVKLSFTTAAATDLVLDDLSDWTLPAPAGSRISEEEKYDGASAFALSYKRTGAPYVYTAKYSLSDACNVISFDAKGDGATGLILRFADATNAFVVSYDLSEVPAYWQHYEISLADPKWTVNGETSLSDYLAALEEDASALPAALASLRFLGEVIPSFDHVECVLSARTPAEEDAAFSLGSLTLLYREEPATLVTQPLFRKGSAYVLCEEVESGDEIYRNVVKLSFTDTTFLVFSTALKEAIYMEGTPSFDEAAATMSFASQDGASFLLSTYFEMNGELLKVESASGVGAKYLAGKTFRLAADDVFTFEDGEVNKPYLGEDWTAYNETSNGFKPFASTETQIFTSELLLDDPSAGEGEKSSKKVLTFATGAQQTNRFVFQRARSLGLTNSVALTFANAGEPFDAKIKVVGIDVSGEEYYFFGSEGKFGYADVTVRSGLFVAEKTLDADFDLVSLYLEVRNVSEREALRLSLAELAFSYEAEIEDVSLYSKPVITPEEGALSFSHAEYENAAFEYSFDKVNYISGSRYDIPVDASGDYTIWVRALIGEEERPSDLARFDYSVSPVTISNISVSIGEDGKHTAVWSTNGVSSVRVTETVEKKDQEGNALLDEGGNPIYEEVELSEYASITDCTASFDKNVTLYVSAAPLPYDPQKKLFYVGSVEAPPKKIRVDARLEAPVLFASADGDGIEWAPVDGAKWYSVQVGDFEPRMQEERFFAFQKSVGEYTVRVTSIDEDGIAYSNASEPYTYTVRAVTVKEFKVEETDFFAKVVAYRAFLKDSDKAEIELSLSLNDDGDLLGSYTAEGLGLHSVTLRIATGYDAENKILYILDPFLEEQLASGALSQDEDPRYAVGFVKIEPLDPPEILPNDAGDGLTWSTGWYNEAKYLLEVKYNDGEWQTLSDGSERVTDYLFSEREGHYVIRVKAIGNGKTLLSGPFTEYAFEIKTLSLEEIDYALEGPLDALLARVNITAVARLTEVKKGTDAYDGEPLSETADISVSAFGGYDLSTHIYYAGSNGKIEKSKEIIVPHYLAAPVLTDDAEGIYWTPVKDVDYYFVTVEKLDDEGSVISTRTAQIDTVKDAAGYAFYFERKNGVYQEGSYRVIVVSRNNKPAHYPSDYAAAVFTYRIRPVEIGDITVKGNTASWTYAALDLALAVKDALVDDSYPAYNKTSYTNPSSEDCAITLVATGGYDATRHILYVIPQGHPTNYVEKSCDIEYSQLLSPTLSVNAEETGLEWGAVTNATSFDVAVKAHGVLPEDTDYQNQTDMTYAFSSVVGKYDVYVKAVDRNTTIDDSEPAVFTYETIDVALSSITITETGKTTRRASWTKQGKTYVSTDGVDYARTEKTSFEPSEIPETTHYYLRCTAGFVSSGEHEGKYYYGETKETDALVIIPIFLSAPTLTLGESGVRVSAPDLRAEHFRVVLNGVAQENVALTASVIPYVQADGVYTLALTAYHSDEAQYPFTDASASVTYTVKTVDLGAPDASQAGQVTFSAKGKVTVSRGTLSQVNATTADGFDSYTYSYTPSAEVTVSFTASTGLDAARGIFYIGETATKEVPLYLAAPTLKKNEDEISVSPVGSPVGYEVSYKKEDGSWTTPDASLVSEEKIAYRTEKGTYTLRLVAKYEKETLSAVSLPSEVTYKTDNVALTVSRPNGGTTVSWTAAARDVQVKVDTSFVNATGSYTVTGKGDHKVTVYAYRGYHSGSNTYYHHTSAGLSKEESFTIYKLSAPTLSVSQSGVSWTSVSNATDYAVTLNGKTTSWNASSRTTPLATAQGSYTVKVKAIGSSNGIYESSDEKSISYEVKTVTLSNIAVSGKTASWSATAYSTEYKVDSGSYQTTTATSYTVTSGKAGSYVVKVKANGGFDSSKKVYYYCASSIEKSNTIKLTKLAAPTLTASSSGISWAKVSNASSYSAKTDSGSYAGNTNMKASYSTSTGSHTLYVKAVASDSSAYVDSDAASFSYVTKQPAISFLSETSSAVTWTMTGLKAQYSTDSGSSWKDAPKPGYTATSAATVKFRAVGGYDSASKVYYNGNSSTLSKTFSVSGQLIDAFEGSSVSGWTKTKYNNSSWSSSSESTVELVSDSFGSGSAAKFTSFANGVAYKFSKNIGTMNKVYYALSFDIRVNRFYPTVKTTIQFQDLNNGIYITYDLSNISNLSAGKVDTNAWYHVNLSFNDENLKIWIGGESYDPETVKKYISRYKEYGSWDNAIKAMDELSFIMTGTDSSYATVYTYIDNIKLIDSATTSATKLTTVVKNFEFNDGTAGSAYSGDGKWKQYKWNDGAYQAISGNIQCHPDRSSGAVNKVLSLYCGYSAYKYTYNEGGSALGTANHLSIDLASWSSGSNINYRIILIDSGGNEIFLAGSSNGYATLTPTSKPAMRSLSFNFTAVSVKSIVIIAQASDNVNLFVDNIYLSKSTLAS